MLQSGKDTAFIIYELFRDYQGEGKKVNLLIYLKL